MKKSCEYLREHAGKTIRSIFTVKCRGAAHSTCHLIYSIPKEIQVVFRNRLSHDYRFMIKDLVKNLNNNSIAWDQIMKKKNISGSLTKEVKRAAYLNTRSISKGLIKYSWICKS